MIGRKIRMSERWKGRQAPRLKAVVELAPTSTPPEPLYCYAISSKRYALFNLGADGAPILRKASAHGLDDKRPPYDDDHGPASIPNPVVRLSEIGVDRWQHDLWYQIIKAALAGRFDAVPLDYSPALQLPAMSRYAATTPDILNWFKTYNADRPYALQVRPFNFLSAFQETSCSDLSFIGEIEPSAKSRRRKGAKPTLRPIAPYSRDLVDAAKACFDRETSQPILADRLKTYAQALSSYHYDRSRSSRTAISMIADQHVVGMFRVARVDYIGKEFEPLGRAILPRPRRGRGHRLRRKPNCAK